MGGSSMEEALIEQRHQADPTDVARVSVPAGAAVAILVYFLAIWMVPILGPMGRGLLGVTVGLYVGLRLHRLLNRQRLEREAREMQAERDAQEAKTSHELGRMAESGRE